MDVPYRGSSDQVRKIIDDLLNGLSGKPTSYGAHVRGIKFRVGMVALRCIQESFVVKADGATGDDGITWPALKRQTIANRPVNLSKGSSDVILLKSHGIKPHGKYERGYLTEAQNKRWRMIFATRKAWLRAKHGMGEAAASARAAQIAWSVLKSEGAKTKLDVLGSRHVQIGLDTGRLFASMSPGTTQPESHPLLAPPPPAPIPADRILREDPGAIVVGSNVVYAGRFHAIRKLWPGADLPPAWANQIEDEGAKTGIVEAIEMILRSASGEAAA